MGHREPLHPRAVHSYRFDGEAANRVDHHVYPEDIAVKELNALLASKPHQQHEIKQVPYHFVGEGGVETHIGAELLPRHFPLPLHAYLDAPGQGGGAAECFLVKIVAPAAYCLAERQTRSGDVAPPERRKPVAIAVNQHGHRAAYHRALYAQAALGDVNDVQEILVVEGVAQVDQYEPNTRPYDARYEHPRKHLPDVLRVLASAFGFLVRYIRGRDDPQHYHNAVPVNRYIYCKVPYPKRPNVNSFPWWHLSSLFWILDFGFWIETSNPKSKI